MGPGSTRHGHLWVPAAALGAACGWIAQARLGGAYADTSEIDGALARWFALASVPILLAAAVVEWRRRRSPAGWSLARASGQGVLVSTCLASVLGAFLPLTVVPSLVYETEGAGGPWLVAEYLRAMRWVTPTTFAMALGGGTLAAQKALDRVPRGPGATAIPGGR